MRIKTHLIRFLRTLITTYLGICEFVEDDVLEMITTTYKLTKIGWKVDDKWVNTHLLKHKFIFMIMGIER